MGLERRRYLVGYDIRDDKRLRQVHKVAKSYGWPMQYSLFVCDLDRIELVALQTDLARAIHHTQDSIAIIDVGDPRDRGRTCFNFMGAAPTLPSAGPLIL